MFNARSRAHAHLIDLHDRMHRLHGRADSCMQEPVVTACRCWHIIHLSIVHQHHGPALCISDMHQHHGCSRATVVRLSPATDIRHIQSPNAPPLRVCVRTCEQGKRASRTCPARSARHISLASSNAAGNPEESRHRMHIRSFARNHLQRPGQGEAHGPPSALLAT